MRILPNMGLGCIARYIRRYSAQLAGRCPIAFSSAIMLRYNPRCFSPHSLYRVLIFHGSQPGQATYILLLNHVNSFSQPYRIPMSSTLYRLIALPFLNSSPEIQGSVLSAIKHQKFGVEMGCDGMGWDSILSRQG